MKYKQLVLGFVIGILFSYGAYRIAHHIQRAGGISALGVTIGQPAQADQSGKSVNVVQFSKFGFTTKTNLGQVTFHYDLIPTNGNYDAAMQLFLLVDGSWQEFTPSDANGTLIFHLQQNTHSEGEFKIDLPKGVYTGFRAILFDCPDGSTPDFGKAIYDTNKDKLLASVGYLDLHVTREGAPAGNPVLSYPPNPIEEDEGDGLCTITYPVIVHYAASYPVDGSGFWIMAKGSGGFAQAFAATNSAVASSDPSDPGLEIRANLVLKDVKPGVYNVQFGIFRQNFGNPIQWVFPGPNFEAGHSSWEVRANEAIVPPRVKVANGQFKLLTGTPYNFYKKNSAGSSAVSFVRGGNYGNAINWTIQPELNTPEYFQSLAAAGCQYIRFNFNPDLYLEEHVYQDSVDQVVQNIWSAGLYPIIAPQDLPSGDTLTIRIERGRSLMRRLAERYAGRSIWLEVCNEPHEFGSWSAWKPVAVEYVKTIRTVDPDAFVIVPFEFYSTNGNDAAKSPITETHVDLYDAHAYVKPTDVATNFESAIQAGLPVFIGEYGSTNADYLHAMDLSFQSLPKQPLAIAPWAFTTKGQDTLPLIDDGTTSPLSYTPAGQAIADDFSSWDAGHRVN